MSKVSYDVMSTERCSQKNRHGIQCIKFIKQNVVNRKGTDKPLTCYTCGQKNKKAHR